MLGQLQSSVILASKTRQTTFQIHHIALSANVTFSLTLPRTVRVPSLSMFRTKPGTWNSGVVWERAYAEIAQN
jgi:hypothetical protein